MKLSVLNQSMKLSVKLLERRAEMMEVDRLLARLRAPRSLPLWQSLLRDELIHHRRVLLRLGRPWPQLRLAVLMSRMRNAVRG